MTRHPLTQAALTRAMIASFAAVAAVAAACSSNKDSFQFYELPDAAEPALDASAGGAAGSDGLAGASGVAGTAQGGSSAEGGSAGGLTDDGSAGDAQLEAEASDAADATIACANDPETTPNDTMATEVDLGEIDDCADFLPTPLHGVLADAQDVDWYRYRGVDGWNPLCGIEAIVKMQASQPIELCAFVEREAGTPTDFKCSDQATVTTEGTFPGCCLTGTDVAFDLEYDHLTVTPTDTAKIHIRVRGAPADSSCVGYDLNYKF